MFALLAATALWASVAHAQSDAAPSSSVIHLFLPMQAANFDASVVTAAPSATVYAVGCAIPTSACATGCDFNSPVTITEGSGTLVYTWTDQDAQLPYTGANNITQDVMTVNCALQGSTQAICTGISMNTTTTTTLSGSQVSYVPVTLTAGASISMPTYSSTSGSASGTAGSGGSGSSGASASASKAAAAPMATMAKYAAGAVAGIAAVGLL